MRKRILWISLLITMLGMLLFSVMATQVYYNHSVSSVEDTIRVYMNFYDGSKEMNEPYAKELSEKMGGARVTFIAADGTVRADSTGENLSENHIGRPEVQEATAKGEGFSVRFDRDGYDLLLQKNGRRIREDRGGYLFAVEYFRRGDSHHRMVLSPGYSDVLYLYLPLDGLHAQTRRTAGGRAATAIWIPNTAN